MTQQSFACLKAARKFRVDYGDVLIVADWFIHGRGLVGDLDETRSPFFEAQQRLLRMMGGTQYNALVAQVITTCRQDTRPVG